MVKIVQAPFIDSYYFKSIGKCKTYIGGFAFALSIALFFIAPHIEELARPKTVNLLTAVWTGVVVSSIFIQISGEMLIIKIFKKPEDKPRDLCFLTSERILVVS